MPSPRAFARRCVTLLCLMATFSIARPTLAEVLAPNASLITTMQVPLGQSAAVTVTGDVERIVLAQPDIASVDQVGPRRLFVIGREIGATNLLVYGPGAELLQVVNIEVGYAREQLQAELAATLPGEPIQVSNLSGGLLLRGAVSTPQVAAMALDLAQRTAGGEVMSVLEVQPDQVMLEVQLVEASEEDLREIGISLGVGPPDARFQSGAGLIGADAPHSLVTAGGHIAGLDLDAALRSLEQRGSTRILARPQILALSGETASFRSGGEFPFPVPSRDGVTIEFKPYGTAISVLPTVQTNGLIRLDLTAEVSSIDPRNSLRIGSFTVPALNTRRASTRLELRDGERFVFAGLFSEGEQSQASQTPWAASLPLVGPLFGAVRTRQQHLQLAIIVTARVVQGPNVEEPAPTAATDVTASQPYDTATQAPRTPSQGPKPKGLLNRIRSLSVVSTVSRRITSVANLVVQAPRRAWALLETLSHRFGTATSGSPKQA